MKTENVKLLDLQTGKYLELGKDFEYGGSYIRRIDCEKEIYCSINNQYNELTTILQNYFSNKQLSVSESCYIDNLKKGTQLEANANVDRFLQNELFCVKQKPHINPLINNVAEKIGAVIYGGKYVLLMTFKYLNKEIKVGDIITAKTLTTSKDCISIKQHTNQIVCFRNNTAFEHDGYNMGFVICENLKCFGINGFWKHRAFDYEERQLDIIGNIFEEHSRQLRKEENKFDELMEKLK